MALVRCDFFSDALGMQTSMTVLLPQSASSAQIGVGTKESGKESSGAGGAGGTGGDFPVLYLLHGLSDDDTIWTRRTSLERYVADRGLAVVMPQVQRSFYADEVWGRPYWTFVAEELPRTVRSLFQITDDPARTFVAGLSMGGYGAMKLALRHPERFAAAASLSGVLDLADRIEAPPRAEDPRMWQRVFGEPAAVRNTPDDLLHLIEQVDSPPPLYIACGTEDPLFESNVRFREACAGRGVPLTVDFAPGQHEWGFWDDRIKDVLAWLPL